MTIASQTIKAGPFTGNDSTTEFPFSFKVFDPANLKVYVRDNTTGNIIELAYSVDYSVTLNSDQDATPGGYITFPIASSTHSVLSATQELAIVHCPPLLQKTDLADGATFRAQTLEDMVDYLTVIVQCLSDKLSGKLGLPDDELAFKSSLSSYDLPNPVAGALLGWDDTGTSIINYIGSPNSIPSNSGDAGDIAVWSNSGGLSFIPTDAGNDGDLAIWTASGGISSIAFDELSKIKISSTEPTSLYAGLMWIDTSIAPFRLKIRNSDNTAWTDIGSIEESGLESADELLTKLKTVDGAGSGLDADFIRGLPADFTANFNTNGYTKLPNGLIIQWIYYEQASALISDSDYLFTFPITFPNKVLSVSAICFPGTKNSTSHDYGTSIYNDSLTTSSVKIKVWDRSTLSPDVGPGKIWVFVVGH